MHSATWVVGVAFGDFVGGDDKAAEVSAGVVVVDERLGVTVDKGWDVAAEAMFAICKIMFLLMFPVQRSTGRKTT